MSAKRPSLNPEEVPALPPGFSCQEEVPRLATHPEGNRLHPSAVEWGRTKLISDQATGIIALILRGRLAFDNIEIRLLPLLHDKFSARRVRPDIRLLIVASSDQKRGFGLATY